MLQFRLKLVFVRRNRHSRKRLAASSECAVAEVLDRVGKREVLEVHAVLKRLLLDLVHLRAERDLRQVRKCPKRHATYPGHAVSDLHFAKVGASEKRMVPYARNRIGNLHLLQRGAVEERDVADRLDILAPVDRLQSLAVVEERVREVTVKGRAAGLVAIRDASVVSPSAIGHSRQRFYAIAQSH